MKLKPKMSVHNKKALLYRRYTDIIEIKSLKTLYKTQDDKVWALDGSTLTFKEVFEYPSTSNIIVAHGNDTAVLFKDKTFIYSSTNGWEEKESTLQAVVKGYSSNISTIQANKYYYVGAFDYIIKGTQEMSETQFLKGNILNLTSVNIMHFNDYINLDHDDLVVVDGRLYSVANPSISFKQQPKKYKIYTATLNSII